MKALLLTIGALAAAFSLAVGLSSASAANGSTVTRAKVAVAGTGLGKVLVDGRGHTLYLFAKDRHGKSSCTGQCAGFWPPLIAAGKPRAAAGAKASLLGTTKRADGRLQVTYNHHPLYTFVKDTSEGPDKRRGSSTPSAPSGTPSQRPEPRSRKPTRRAATAAATRQRAATGPGTRSHGACQERASCRPSPESRPASGPAHPTWVGHRGVFGRWTDGSDGPQRDERSMSFPGYLPLCELEASDATSRCGLAAGSVYRSLTSVKGSSSLPLLPWRSEASTSSR